MPSTRIAQFIAAPRAAVYRALLDPLAIAHWRVPRGMTCEVLQFEAHAGGRFRVSLTYDLPTGTGKTTPHTDTYHGQFVKLVPDEEVVEVIEFETDNPAMSGAMTITTTLTEREGGTELFAVHDDLPAGVSPADNEYGWRQSLAQLAALVEAANSATQTTPRSP